MRKGASNLVAGVAALLLAGGLAVPLSAKEPKLSAEDLIAKNLAAIGTPEARAAVKTRIADGDAQFHLLVGGSGGANGPVKLASDGRKERLLIRFNQPNYSGEEYAYDGSRLELGYRRPGVRSTLEGFIQQSDELVVGGLLGGELTTAWPLYDLADSGAKVRAEGTKKINGKELYKLSYHPKKSSGNLTISFYFDPETFRHVLTTYEMVLQAGLASGGVPPNQGGASTRDLGNAQGNLPSDQLSAQQHGSRAVVEESFENFQTVDGLTLPTTWKVKISQESNQGALIQQFQMDFKSIRNNVTFEGNIFTLQ